MASTKTWQPRPLDRVRLRGDLLCGTILACYDRDWQSGHWIALVRWDGGQQHAVRVTDLVLQSTEHGALAKPNPDNTIQSLFNFE